jgi:hypothetical protein
MPGAPTFSTLQFVGPAGASGLSWSDPANWMQISPPLSNVTPASPDQVLLTTSTDGTTTIMNYDGSLSLAQYPYGLTFLNIDATAGSGSSITLILGDGYELAAKGEGVGDNGYGILDQTGGTNVVEDLFIADGIAAGQGLYELSGDGTLTVGAPEPAGNGALYLGFSGSGTFNQSGGTTTVGQVEPGTPEDPLDLGTEATGQGTYTLSGTGSLTVNGNTIVGDGGSGTFTQSDTTTNTITGALVLGYNGGATGHYNLGGSGNLSAFAEVVGYAGTGDFDQTGGTNTVGPADGGTCQIFSLFKETIVNGTLVTYSVDDGALYVGSDAGGTGTYDLAGGTLTAGTIDVENGSAFNIQDAAAVANFNYFNLEDSSTVTARFDEHIGTTANPVSTFTQQGDGSSNSIGGALFVGDTATGATGTYDLEGGTVVVGGDLYVGDSADGTFNQSGGGNTITGDLEIGVGATGTYKLGAGAVKVGGDLYVGDGANGTFNQSGGGSNTITGDLEIGVGATGTYDLGAGTVKVGGNLYVGDGADGTFNQSGTTTNQIGGDLEIGVNAGATGTYDLGAGTVKVGGDLYVGDGGTGNLTIGGGGSAAISVGGTVYVGVYGTGIITLDSDGNLEANIIVNPGNIAMDGGSIDPPDGITNEAGGSISGFGTIDSDIVNNGSLDAAGGTLLVSGAITGTGQMAIAADSGLELGGSVGPGQTLSFTGPDAILTLDLPSSFAAAITIGAGDQINLTGIVASGVTYNGTTLTVTPTGGGPALTFAVSENPSNPGVFDVVTSSATFTVGTVTPTVEVSINSTDVNLAHNTATVTFAFSQAPVSFVIGDTTATGGKLSNLQEVNATTYTATFTATANTDISNAQVNVTAGSWSDADGNPGAGGSTGSFTADTVTPTVPTVNLDVAAGTILTANAAHGVLAGASDPAPSQPLTVSAVNGVNANVGHAITDAYGTLTLNADGSYSYTATASSASLPHGAVEDNITFTVTDVNGNSTTATLSILVYSSNETLYVGTAGGSLNVGNGISAIDGRAGNETINAGNGADDVVAGTNDAITLGNGQDVVTGGANDTIQAGNGSDSISTGANSHVTVGNGSDTIAVGDISTVALGTGQDTVTAGANAAITGGNGQDAVTAGATANITLGNGNDTVTAGANSTVTLGNGNDHATAGSDSTIKLGNGTDTVIAGTNNVINLGNGADTVYAASGDTITVGNGHDTFVFGLSPGQTTAGLIGPVTINHFNPANDVIEIASTLPGGWDTSFTRLESHIQTISGNAVITLDTSGDTITLVGVLASSLHASDFHFV